MYQIIDNETEQQKYNEIVNKITPQSLGLKPTTDFALFVQQKIIDENPEKTKKWVEKGSIGIMEAGKRYAEDFNGTYDNIIEKKPNEKSLEIKKKIENNIAKKTARDERVEFGTASILDKIGNALDKIGDNSYEAQVQYAQQQDNLRMPHKDNSDYRYKPVGIDSAGSIVYNETDLRKKIGFAEALTTSMDKGQALPLISGAVTGLGIKKYRNIAERIRNGEAIRQDELDYVNRYNERLQEEFIRGYTIGGGIGKNIAPSLIAFGSEIALGVGALRALGLTGKGKALGTLAGSNLLKTKKVSKGIAKAAAFTTGTIAEAGMGAGVTTAVNPARLFATYQERRLNDEMKITDRGTITFQEATESPAKALFKSLGQVYISYFSEGLGGLIGQPLKQGGKAIKSIGAEQFAKVIKANPKIENIIKKTAPIFAKAYEKINNLPIKGKAVDWLKSQVKFDGFIEELGEEVLEDILNLTIGTNNEERSLENYVSKIVKTPEEWAVLCGVIALQGATISIAGNTLANIMHKNGASFEDIVKVSQNSTEAEKIELIDEAMKRGELNIPENALMDNIEIQKEEVEQKVYNQLLKGNVSEDVAIANSKLVGQFFSKWNKQGRDVFQNLVNKLEVQYNIPSEVTEAELKNQIQSTYFQSMIAGINPKQKVDVVDLSAQFPSDSKLSRKELTSYIKSLIGTALASSDKKAILNFVARSKRVGKRDVLIPEHISNSSKVEKTYKSERNTAVKNITDLIKKSVLIDVEPNNKKATKPNIDNYLRFYVPVRINNDIYTIRISAENNLNKNFFNVLNADVYDLIIDKKMTATSTSPVNTGQLDEQSSVMPSSAHSIVNQPRSLMKTTSNNNITNSSNNINPNQVTIEKMLKGVVGADGITYFQSAYHGTPHKFDKFSTDNIGTGEGAQAHGWGLYFAENKEVSEKYRENLSHPEYFYNNKEIKPDTVEHIALQSVYMIKAWHGLTLEEAVKKAIDYHKNEKQGASLSNKMFRSKVINFLNKADISKMDMKYGQLYKVDIPESDVLLDEDKKFSEQPENVQNAIKELAEEYARLEFEIEQDKTGKDIYQTLAEDAGSYADASMELNDVGIKGITYDGKTDGRCYVIFDDNAVDVIKTYYQEAENEKLTMSEREEIADLSEFSRESELKDERLIAGYSYSDVMDKLTAIYEKLGNEKLSQPEQENLIAKAHILETAFEAVENSSKFSNEEYRQELILNAYYIMNNQEVPQNYLDTDRTSRQTYNDLKEIHDRKKEEAERKYLGYFNKVNDKSFITIMANHDSSTALHELGHFFLEALNEIANVDKNAQEQLEAINKWLGFSGEYTIAQQEKFARSFEAYLYKGKAPNNKLRKVFQNFKEWLKAVYSHITELADKGADISNEVTEMFDKMFANDEYYQERKQTNEVLRKVKNISRKEKMSKVPVRDDSELDEVEKRHKNAAYAIVSAATGKSIKYLKTIFETNSTKKSFAKKREAIEMLLDKADDKITVSGGLRNEWKEFYTDTGVSYNNDEVDGDYKLFEQALDTIINKSYRNPEKMLQIQFEERTEYYANAIDEANREYNALIRSFKKENRNVALSAIYEWLESLDNQIKQDFEDKFILDSAMIEREENAEKFEKAKRQILSKALELENRYNISDNEKYQEVVKEIMKNLNFLQPADKAKLTVNILDVPSVDFLMSSIDNILDIAKTMEDVNYRRKLEREIHKELQKTKNTKKNGRTVGKYDYKTNKIFEELRQLDRLSPEEANELRLEAEKFAKAEDNGFSYKDKLTNKFLSYKAGGRTFANTELMKEIYDEIVRIKLIGKSAKSEIELIEKLDESKDIDELINIVENKKDAKFLVKGYISGFGNLESTINAIFNKYIKEKYASEILYDETQAQAWQYKVKSDFEKEAAKIYGLPVLCWDKKVLEYLGEKHTYTEIRRKYNEKGEIVKVRNINRTLTKMDIIGAYIYSKNEVLEKRLINQFGEDTLNSMFDELSLDDVKFAELMMRTAQSFYPIANKAFIEKYGLDLPKVSCYFPSTPERGSEIDLYNEYSSKSLGNGFTKSRSMSETLPMDFHNPVAILYSHIDGVAKFAFMSKNLDRANLRFKNPDLKRVIINKYGEDVYKTLEQNLINITYKKEAQVFNGVYKIIDNMISNWIGANVSIKPIVGLKQLLSANNYAVDMPYMAWQKGFLKALANPKATIYYMMNIPYIKARYSGNMSNEFLKQTIENSAFAITKKFKDSMSLFIKMGDIGAIIFGGKPYIDYLIKEKGMSEEQAIKQFILSTNRSQQSSAVSSLSNFQIAMTRNPMGKLFIAFKNSPQQYVRMCGDAIVSVANGDMSKKDCAKIIFQYAYLQPFLYAAATSGSLFRLLFTGDTDDLVKDLKMSIFNLNANAIPLLGDIYLYAMNKLAYKEKVMPQVTPLLGDIENEINKLSKEDVELKDYLEFTGYLGLHVGFGVNSKAIVSMGSSVGDFAKGDIAKGSMKTIGYTDKRAKNITKK